VSFRLLLLSANANSDLVFVGDASRSLSRLEALHVGRGSARGTAVCSYAMRLGVCRRASALSC